MGKTSDKPYILSKLVKVRESEVHGRGLFARNAIAEGTEIGRCKVKKAKKDGPYVLWLGEKLEEAVKVVCDLRFINHGKTPNVAYYQDLTVVALRDIGEGEELLHYYGDGWD